ncbi:hypothetical protein KCU93_g10402, partial [Aureobasidium melanogenum]
MASSSQNASELFSHSHVETLTGQTNFVRWHRDLKAVANTKNLWNLISGAEEVLQRPTRPVKPVPATIPLGPTTRSKSAKAATASGTDTPDDSKEGVTLATLSSEAYKEAVEDYKISISEYRLDLEQFEKQDARLRLAKGLLSMSVDPAIRTQISEIDDPSEAFEEIKSVCQMTDARALGIALSKMEELRFTKNDTVSSFLNNVILLQSDINELQGSYSDVQVIAKVVRSLPQSYSGFVNHWHMLAGTGALPNTIKELHSQLLSAEANQPNQLNKPKNRDKNNRNGADKPGNRLLSCCNKYGTHKEEECWTLHPELRKSSTSDKPTKPRANVVTEAAEKEKSKEKEKDKDKKPAKITAQAIVGNRELFELMCAEAFKPNVDLQLELHIAINTPLPSSDDHDLDIQSETALNIPGAYPEDSPSSSISAVSNNELWHAAVNQEIELVGPQPSTLPQRSWIFHPRRSQLQNIVSNQSSQPTQSIFGIDQAPATFLHALTSVLVQPESDAATTSSEEHAIHEALEELDNHHNDTHAQHQLQRELHESVARDSVSNPGTSTHPFFSATPTDSYRQTIPSGSETPSVSGLMSSLMDQWKGMKLSLTMVILQEVVDLEGNAWIADSGASLSITNDRAWFNEFRSFTLPMGTAASDEHLLIEGGGTVTLLLDIGDGQPVELEIHNVAYAPSARYNILSISQVAEKAGLRGHWSRDELTFHTAQDVQVGIAPLIDGLYHVQLAPNSYPVLPPRVMLTHPNAETGKGGVEEQEDNTSQDGGVQEQDDTSSEDGGVMQVNDASEDGGVTQEMNGEEEPHDDSSSSPHDSDSELDLTEDESSDDLEGPLEPPPPFDIPEIDYNDPVWVWHRRLGHLGFDNMIKLLKVAEGIDLTEKQIKSKIRMICPVCATTKAVNRIPRDLATHRRRNVGELVHIDTWGPYPVRAYDGTYYQLAIIDDATRYTWTERFSAKHELPAKLKALHKRIERKHGITIAAYRLNNELPKYGKITRWIKKHGITIKPAIPYRHHMNGVAERGFRTERERSSAMMRETHLAGRVADIIGKRTQEALEHTTIPEELWPEAFELGVWLKNRAPSRALRGKITPWQALYGIKPDLSKEKIFGSRLYSTIPPERRRKSLLLPRGRLLYFIGYESEAVMIAYDSDNHTVERVTAARVEDGVGTQDPHERPSFQDRESDNESPSDHESDKDNTHQTMRQNNVEEDSGNEELSESEEINNQGSPTHDQSMDESDTDGVYHRDGPSSKPHSPSPSITHLEHLQMAEDPQPPSAPSPQLDEGPQPTSTSTHLTDEEASSDEEQPVVSRFFAKKGTRKRVNMAKSNAWEDTSTVTTLDLLKEIHPQDPELRYNIFKELYPQHNLTPSYVRNVSRQIRATDYRFRYVEKYPMMEDKSTRDIIKQQIRNSTAHKTPKKVSRRTIKNAVRKGGHRFFTNEEDMFLDIIIKSQNYNKMAAHLIYLDIFSDILPETHRNFEKFSTHWDKRANSNLNVSVIDEDEELRERLQQKIDESQALAAFEPDTWAYNKKLSQIRCVNCRHKNSGSVVCNDKPCKKCIGQKVPCTVEVAENTYISYYTDELMPEWAKEEVDCCHTCNYRSRQGHRNYCGNGEFPCQPCVDFAQRVAQPRRCTRPHPDGGILVYTFTGGKMKNNRFGDDKEESSSHIITKDTAENMSENDDDASSESSSEDSSSEDSDESPRKRQKSRVGVPTIKRGRQPPKDDDEDSTGPGVDGGNKKAQPLYQTKAQASSSSNKNNNNNKSSSSKGKPSTHAASPKCLLVKLFSKHGPEPNTRKQALSLSDAQQWQEAMLDEYNSLIENETWEVVQRPPGANVLSSRWVFKRKLASDGSVAKHKARFVVRGFKQVSGVDYDETYASVVKAPSYRLLFALQVRYGWKCHQMDVKTAFLHGNIEHDIYVQPPDGFPERKGYVFHLKKALYGLKQSPRQWGIRFRRYLEANGWTSSKHDPCIFIHNGPKPMFIDAYVDDIKIFAKTDEEIFQTKALLSSQFPMTDLGPCSFYLGMHVNQGQDGSVHLHQAAYIQQILERFGMEDIYPRHIPMRTDCKLSQNTGPAKPKDFIRLYQSKVGSLLYLSCIARPDLAEAVGVVSRYNSNPNDSHMEAVDQIIAYIKATPNLGLCYSKDPHDELHAYSDADWAGCKDSARSTTGWVVMLSGAPISWSSKRQKSVALSTCESEYVAGYKAAQELVWITGLLNELRVKDISTREVVLQMDNQAALKLSRNPEFHDRTKHINIKFHYLRELNSEGLIKTQYVNTKNNLADLFTKPLPRDTFEGLVRRLGLTTATCIG